MIGRFFQIKDPTETRQETVFILVLDDGRAIKMWIHRFA